MREDWISDSVKQIKASKIREMFNIASTMKDVVNLAIGEPDFNTPDVIIKAAEKAMKDGKTHYTLNAGTKKLRQHLLEHLKQKNNVNLNDIDSLIVTNGGMGALYLTMRAVLNRGDEVLLPRPSWTNYEAQIALAGGKSISVPLKGVHSFIPQLDDIIDRITEKTKAILINSPSNPTGAVYPEETLRGIAALAREYNFLIISDEVYEKFVWDGNRHISIASLPDAEGRTITVNSFSKTFAMTGWRLGYAYGPNNIIGGMIKLQEDIFACASSIAQEAAIEGLLHESSCITPMIEEYKKRRTYILDRLKLIPKIKPITPHGSFYIFIDITESGLESDPFVLDLLENVGVCLVPGTAFGAEGEGFVRMSYAASMKDLKEAADRLERYFNR